MPALTLNELKQYSKWESDVFIETGTYLGAGLDFALNYPWKKMYSCELLRTYYDLATASNFAWLILII